MSRLGVQLSARTSFRGACGIDPKQEGAIDAGAALVGVTFPSSEGGVSTKIGCRLQRRAVLPPRLDRGRAQVGALSVVQQGQCAVISVHGNRG